MQGDAIAAGDGGAVPTMQQIESMRPAAQAYYDALPEQLRPDATIFQVRVFMAQNGIDPDTVPAILDSLYPDGPERWEAKARWATAPRVPFDHPLVSLIAGQLSLTPSEVWDQILAVV